MRVHGRRKSSSASSMGLTEALRFVGGLAVTIGLGLGLIMSLQGIAKAQVVFKGPRSAKDSLGAKTVVKLPTPVSKGLLSRINSLPDPFKPYFAETPEEMNKRLEAMEKLKELSKPKTELQKFSLAQLTLTSVLKTPKGIWAMVRDPSGKGYVVKRGTFIGTKGGQVSEVIMKRETSRGGLPRLIRKIIIKEPYVDRHGEIKYKFSEKEIPDVFK